MAKKKITSKKFGYISMASVSLMALAVALTRYTPEPKQIEKIEEIAEVYDNVAPVKNSVLTVPFINDTLDHYASALLIYQNNKIIRNFVKNSKLHRMQLPYFSHERWHHHNKKMKYWRKIRYSPSQFIQLRMHEEISANVAAILTADFEYQLAEDKEAVIKKYENTYMKFYFQAIKDGTIKPGSHKPEDLDKKYSLLINGTIDMWERMFRGHYTPSLEQALKQYLKDFGFRQANSQNYQKTLTHMYTFGGVDLSRYIKNDAKFEDAKVQIFNEMANVKAFNRSLKLRASLIDDIYAYAGYLRDVSISQRPAVLQHIIIASKLKFELKKLNGYALTSNTSAITAAYDKVMYELSRNTQYVQFVNQCDNLDVITTPQKPTDLLTLYNVFPVSSLLTEENKEIISKIYQFHGIDLTALIKNFDMNILPNKQENLFTIGTKYFSNPPLDDIICQIPAKMDNHVSDSSLPIAAEAVTTHTLKKMPPVKKNTKKHLSDDLFVNIPNFEEALLHPEAMTQEARTQLANLFKQYDAIPDEFKNCDVEAIEKFIKENGDPHYFKDKENPFLPAKSAKSKPSLNKRFRKNNSLALYRRLNKKRLDTH